MHGKPSRWHDGLARFHVSSVFFGWLNLVRLYSLHKIPYPRGGYNLTLYWVPYPQIKYCSCQPSGQISLLNPERAGPTSTLIRTAHTRSLLPPKGAFALITSKCLRICTYICIVYICIWICLRVCVYIYICTSRFIYSFRVCKGTRTATSASAIQSSFSLGA